MIPVAGARSGQLTLVERTPDDVVVWGGRRKIRKLWRCRCDCGREAVVPDTNFRRSGRPTESCGCYKRNTGPSRKGRRHNSNVHLPEYRTWQSMKARCYNARRRDYVWYGGKGVSVCGRWRMSFASFFADMGPKPSPDHTLDRFPNRRGNYEPGNCRWATIAEQASNRNPPRKRKPQ